MLRKRVALALALAAVLLAVVPTAASRPGAPAGTTRSGSLIVAR